MRKLAVADLPIAPTITCRNVGEIQAALREWGKVVVKPSFGFGGTDVELVTGAAADEAVLIRLFSRYPILICQPYFPHPDGDFRITVVGNEAPLNFRRVPAAGAWKANTMQGASVQPIDAPDELINLAIRAARAVSITIAGLDFIPTPNGYRIIEINNTPGWYLSDPCDQRKVMDSIFDLVEKSYGN